MDRQRLLWIMLAWAGVVDASCSSEVELAEVTGRVTFHGAPARAEIFFTPAESKKGYSGRPSTAYSDANGEFSLTYDGSRAGAVVGKHNVVIRILPAAGGEPASGDDEGEFEDANRTVKTVQLVRQVKRAANHFEFLITF
jgi:hypothetical protein